MKRVFVVLLLLAGISLANAPSDVKVSHIGPKDVVISCKNGADATVRADRSDNGLLWVSCGK